MVARRRSIVALALMLVTAAKTQTHHSFAAVYDQNAPIRVEGTVEALEWKNPHVTLTLLVRGDDGSGTRWSFEMGAPRVLTNRFGWSSDAVRVGDRIIVEGFRARAAGPHAAAVLVTTRTGARLGAVLPFR